MAMIYLILNEVPLLIYIIKTQACAIQKHVFAFATWINILRISWRSLMVGDPSPQTEKNVV